LTILRTGSAISTQIMKFGPLFKFRFVNRFALLVILLTHYLPTKVTLLR